MSTQFEKFYFDKHIFDEEEEEEEIPVEDLIAEAAQNAEEKGFEQGHKEGHAKGYDEGKKDGYDQSIQSIENKTNQAITAVTPLLQTLLQAETEREERFEREALSLCLTIVKKLFPAALSAIGSDEIEASIREILIDQTGQSNIIIDVNPELEDSMSSHIQGLSGALGGMDKIIINPNMDVPVGQCQLSWNHGGASKDLSSVATSIVETLQDLLGISEPASFDAQEPGQQPRDNGQIDDDTAPEICDTVKAEDVEEAQSTGDPDPATPPQAQEDSDHTPDGDERQ